MKNRLLVILIIIAAIFPFAATAFELTEDVLALAALGGLSLVAIIVTVAAIMYRPKRSPEIDTPVQAIPTIKGPPARKEGTPKTAAQAPATKPTATGSTTKPETKRQRAR